MFKNDKKMYNKAMINFHILWIAIRHGSSLYDKFAGYPNLNVTGPD